MSEPSSVPTDASLQELQSLRNQVQLLEARLNALPTTNLLSKKYLVRAFAVLGHSTVASLVIMVPLYAIIFAVVIVIAVAERAH